MNSILQRTEFFGNGHGDGFALEAVSSVGIEAKPDDIVTRLYLNGKEHGRGGGGMQGILVLAKGEFICEMKVWHDGKWVRGLEFKTDRGGKLSGGATHGQPTRVLTDVRVLDIGGSAGWVLDTIAIRYIDGYHISTLDRSKVTFIIGVYPCGTLSEYKETEWKEQECIELVTRHMTQTSTNVTLEFGSAFGVTKAGTETETIDERVSTRRSELESRSKKVELVEHVVGQNQVGIKLVVGDLMKCGNEYWAKPTTNPTVVVADKWDVTRFLNVFDLTGALFTAMPPLDSPGVVDLTRQWTYYTSLQELSSEHKTMLLDKIEKTKKDAASPAEKDRKAP